MSLVLTVMFAWGFIAGYVVGNNDGYFEAQVQVKEAHDQE